MNSDHSLSFDRSSAAAAICRLNEADLHFLNGLIVQRLRLLAQARTTECMAEFAPGDRVRFPARDGKMHEGVVLRLNHKTVSIVTDDRAQWNVSPGLLQRVSSGRDISKP